MEPGRRTANDSPENCISGKEFSSFFNLQRYRVFSMSGCVYNAQGSCARCRLLLQRNSLTVLEPSKSCCACRGGPYIVDQKLVPVNSLSVCLSLDRVRMLVNPWKRQALCAEYCQNWLETTNVIRMSMCEHDIRD